jgi:hypothetical protein
VEGHDHPVEADANEAGGEVVVEQQLVVVVLQQVRQGAARRLAADALFDPGPGRRERALGGGPGVRAQGAHEAVVAGQPRARGAGRDLERRPDELARVGRVRQVGDPQREAVVAAGGEHEPAPVRRQVEVPRVLRVRQRDHLLLP